MTGMLFFSALAKAQEPIKKRKPGFSLNPTTMTELGLSQEQKDKVKAAQVEAAQKAKKIQADGKLADAAYEKGVDSLLTEAQRAKLVELKEAVKAEKKSFVLDKKTTEQLGVTPEVQKKLIGLAGANHISRWNGAQAWTKINKEAVEAQLSVLTPDQLKKSEEMKKEIEDYNKSIQ